MMFLRRSLTSLQRWSVISVKFFILHVSTERRSVPFSNFELTQANYITGSPSSKYEHRRAEALLRNILKYKDLYGKKPIVSLTNENERISIKTAYLT